MGMSEVRTTTWFSFLSHNGVFYEESGGRRKGRKGRGGVGSGHMLFVLSVLSAKTTTRHSKTEPKTTKIEKRQTETMTNSKNKTKTRQRQRQSQAGDKKKTREKKLKTTQDKTKTRQSKASQFKKTTTIQLSFVPSDWFEIGRFCRKTVTPNI
jgi:hypothetical protein